MQCDTTSASSKVGAPVFKLIVVSALNHHFVPPHPKNNNFLWFWESSSFSGRLQASVAGMCWGIEFKGGLESYSVKGCFLSPQMWSPHCSFGSGPTAVPSGLLSVPLPRPLTCLRQTAWWKSEADVRSCSAPPLISLQERQFSIAETIENDEQQMAFPSNQ